MSEPRVEAAILILKTIAPFIIAAILSTIVRSRFARLVERNVMSRSLAHRLQFMTSMLFYSIAFFLSLYIVTGVHEALYAALAVGIITMIPLIPFLTNIVAYYIIVSERVVTPGEYVKLDGIEGVVHSMSMFSTTLRSRQGLVITIPNRLLIEKTLVKLPPERRMIELEVTISGLNVDSPRKLYECLDDISSRLRKTLSECRSVIRGLESDVTLVKASMNEVSYRIIVHGAALRGAMLIPLVSRIILALPEYQVNVCIKSAV